MSLESAKSFVERMKTDEEFRKKVTECKDTEARKALVLKEGFNFTKEELKVSGMELTESDIEGITGGSGGCRESDCRMKG